MKKSDLEAEMDFQMKAIGLPPWECEYRFHPVRRWRFDRAWPERKIALEIEGGTWVGGRHVSGSGFNADCEKYNEAALLGWTIVRVTSNMINEGRALKYIEQALEED